MALSFLSGSGSGSSVTFFDIRLDENYIVFRGNEHEAASAHLQGTLVFCITEPLTTKHVKLTLSGMSRISWNVQSTASVGSTRSAKKENTFFENTWTFRDPGKSKTEILKPGNYEYPFDIVLDGGLPESVEGLPESYIAYRFRADIGRKYAKDVIIRKPLRIIRTLGPSALETAHEMSVENIWPNKVEYTIGTPSKAVIFGTSIQVNFRLVPLLKGLRIGLVSTEVLETHEFTIESDSVASRRLHKDSKTLAKDTYQLNEEQESEILDEEVEGYRFSRYLELPKTLKKCLQDAEIHGIKIRHKLKFNVALQNPDGHVSELRATLPISIFISPQMALTEDNDLVDQSPVADRQALANDLTNAAPPLYGQHQFDQMFSEVDPSGYHTPGMFSTPGTPFGTHSRNISNDNLTALMNGNGGGESPTNGDVSPLALQSRLQNLRVSGTSMAHSPLAQEDHHGESEASSRRHSSNATRDYFDSNASESRSQTRTPNFSPPISGQSEPSPLTNGNDSGQGSGELSRNTSEDNPGARTPMPYSYQIEDLARIPSYSTALRARARTPNNGPDLPSYGAAMSYSRGSSPAPPPTAYIRNSRAH